MSFEVCWSQNETGVGDIWNGVIKKMERVDALSPIEKQIIAAEH